MAFDMPMSEGVDILVLEVGLGGRLDATNVAESDIDVITAISLDHTAILGDTVEKIAAEKAGMGTKAFANKVSSNPSKFSKRRRKQAALAKTLMGMKKS